MARDRSQAIVVRGDRILMIRHTFGHRSFFAVPGGGIEPGETPEESALRELWEEACVRGRIVRPTSTQYKADGSRVFSFLVEIDDDAEPKPGRDPELPDEEQTINGALFMSMPMLSSIDQIYLWASGLNRIERFYEMLQNMKDISF